MSSLDLGNAADFGRATLGDIKGLLDLFGGRDPKLWDIDEGSYNGVLFHVFKSSSQYQGELPSIHDQGGRRKVKYKFPYTDGQTTDDLGALPETFEAEIVLHGQHYLAGLQALLAEFNKPVPGQLQHPVRGIIRAVPETWQITHTSEQRKAALLRVTFIQHSFTISAINAKGQDNTPKTALSKALEIFAAVDSVLAKIATFARATTSVKQLITQDINNFRDGYALALGRMNTTFNGGSSADIPGLLPVNLGGLLGSSGSQQGTTFQTVVSIDRFNSVPVSTITQQQVALSVDDLAKQVNVQRAGVAAIIKSLEAMGGGVGALEFHDDILQFRQAAVNLQNVLEAGIASSQAQVIKYTTPRLMSIREVAFANGLDVNRADEIDLLNTGLDSVNYISKGTVVRVPSA